MLPRVDTAATTAPTEPPAIPFVGRGAELAAIRDVLEGARAGAGQVLVVEGEAGVGKSRLLDEALAVAGELGFELLRGRADELARDRPFGAISDALGLDPGSPDADRSEIGRIALDEDGDDLLAGAGGGGPSDVGFRVVESVLALVERLAATRPLCLVIDDFHWADPSTARVTRAILRALPQLPLAMVLSLRPFPREPAVARVVEDALLAGGRHLVLGGLQEGDVARLAESLCGARPGPRLLRHIGGAAGNPLFVIELASGLRDEGALRLAGDQAEMEGDVLPSSLRRAILRRLASLPEPAVEMLKVASVLGRRFPVTLLAAVVGQRPAELLAPLEQSLEAGVLEESDGELSFHHDLIRDAVYDEIPLPLRRGLHRDTAHVLRSLGAPLSQVAEQFFLGAAPGDAEALEWLSRAARRAAPRSPGTAVKLLQRALELAVADSPASHSLAADLAPLLIQTGRPEEAERLTRDVLVSGPAPETEVSLRRALGEVLWTQGWLEAAIAELEAAAAVEGAPARERGGALALASYLRVFVGEPRIAAAEAESVRAEGQRSGDDFATCLAHQTLALVAEADARIPEAVELATAAVGIANRSDQPRVGHLHPHLSLGLVMLDADRLQEAEAALQEGRRRAERRGTVLWLPLYQAALGWRRAISGEWDDTRAEVEVGLRVADEVGTRLFAPLLHGLAAWVDLQGGRLDESEAKLALAAEEFVSGTTPAWQAEANRSVLAAGARWPLEWGLWLQALLHEARGRPREALSTLCEAWGVAAPLRYFLGYRMFGPDLVRLAVAAGDRSRATKACEQVEQGAARSGVSSAKGAALRCRGLLEDDPDTLLAGVDVYRSTPCVVELAFTLEDAGSALARAGRVNESVTALEEASERYEAAGATRPLARTDALLRTLGVRRRRTGTSGRPSSGWDSLTPTELTVARLAAEGLTNRQIGDRLFVSRRTVETHLAHVFAKLDVASRAQLAAEVARRV